MQASSKQIQRHLEQLFIFPIDTWNLFDRVINMLPRTNNALESWHSAMKADCKKNLSLNKLIAMPKEEQSKTDTFLVSLNAGEFKKKFSMNLQ